jgi:hypothetical protein|tara:strand:+ start:108 stop:347 length:240 start_codon:yes stop_codon:yes gene_type:complete
VPAKKKSNIVSKCFHNNIFPFVGLIGFACWGKNILRNLCEQGVLYTACDSNQNLILGQKKYFPPLTLPHHLNKLGKTKI